MTEEEVAGYARDFADTIYRVAFHTCKNAADSEDVTQDVLLKLYQAQVEFESREHVRRWVIRVAVNQSRKLLRSAWFRKSAPLEDYAAVLEFQDPEESGVFQAVMALPAKYRVPLYLYYYEGYAVREVAALCRLKESTVTTRLQRARQKLKETLDHEEGS